MFSFFPSQPTQLTDTEFEQLTPQKITDNVINSLTLNQIRQIKSKDYWKSLSDKQRDLIHKTDLSKTMDKRASGRDEFAYKVKTTERKLDSHIEPTSITYDKKQLCLNLAPPKADLDCGINPFSDCKKKEQTLNIERNKKFEECMKRKIEGTDGGKQKSKRRRTKRRRTKKRFNTRQTR